MVTRCCWIARLPFFLCCCYSLSDDVFAGGCTLPCAAYLGPVPAVQSTPYESTIGSESANPVNSVSNLVRIQIVCETVPLECVGASFSRWNRDLTPRFTPKLSFAIISRISFPLKLCAEELKERAVEAEVSCAQRLLVLPCIRPSANTFLCI